MRMTEVVAVLRQALPVIGGNDDERVSENRALLEGGEEASQFVVRVGHLAFVEGDGEGDVRHPREPVIGGEVDPGE